MQPHIAFVIRQREIDDEDNGQIATTYKRLIVKNQIRPSLAARFRSHAEKPENTSTAGTSTAQATFSTQSQLPLR